MYLYDFSFLGIGIQQGQPKPSLCESPQKALEILPAHWRIESSATLTQNSDRILIHKSSDLTRLEWSGYLQAYHHIRTNAGNRTLQLNWGGDHSIGLATVAAFTSLYKNGYVLWIDAHADLNTPESSPTGNFHGMPMSILLGLGEKPDGVESIFWKTLSPKNLIYFGLRDLDPYEKHMIEKLKIQTYYCNEINSKRATGIISEIQEKVGQSPLHISFDIDSMDPLLAPSTGVACPNGLSVSQLEIIIQSLQFNHNLRSVDVVEINPKLGSPLDIKQTYAIAFNFLEKLRYLNKEKHHDANHQPSKGHLPIPLKWNLSVWPQN